MKKGYIDFRKYNSNDVSKAPEIFKNQDDQNPVFVLCDIYACLFPYGDASKKPVVYFRHAMEDRYRFGGFVNLGDDYLSPQTSAHHRDIAQKDAVIKPYRATEDGLNGYTFGSEEPFSDFKLYDDYMLWREGDFFDVKAIPFPHAIIDHRFIFDGTCQIAQPCLISGFYEGKPVIGIGGCDRFYASNTSEESLTNLCYFYASGHAVREDGRFESFIINCREDGETRGYYWLQGSEPITVEKVQMETEWVNLPYIDDGTVIYKNAIFRIGEKVIHLDGKWGTKGFTEKPRVERHGQSYVFGEWYEGEKPYKHSLSFSIVENMGAFDWKVQELGFKVIR